MVIKVTWLQNPILMPKRATKEEKTIIWMAEHKQHMIRLGIVCWIDSLVETL
jgi:hypothetical protein